MWTGNWFTHPEEVRDTFSQSLLHKRKVERF